MVPLSDSEVDKDDPDCTFGGNLQPGLRSFQLELNVGVKSLPVSFG